MFDGDIDIKEQIFYKGSQSKNFKIFIWENLRNQSPFEVLTRETDAVLEKIPQTGHYGDPRKAECKPDEAHVTIEGVSGTLIGKMVPCFAVSVVSKT